MKKKYGPLPVWAWGVVGVVTIYLWYRYSQSSSNATGTSSTAVNNGIDPVTGVPYADEQAAYQNEAASAMAPGSGGSSGSVDNGGSIDPNQEFQNVIDWITSLENAGIVQAPGAGNATPPPGNSDGTTPPDNNSTPSTKPQTNARTSTGTLLNPKAILAPFGSTPPPSKAGYTAVGTGNGNWQYVPSSIVNVAGGYLAGSASHNAPVAPKGYITRGLGHGLWEIIPKPKAKTGAKR